MIDGHDVKLYAHVDVIFFMKRRFHIDEGTIVSLFFFSPFFLLRVGIFIQLKRDNGICKCLAKDQNFPTTFPRTDFTSRILCNRELARIILAKAIFSILRAITEVNKNSRARSTLAVHWNIKKKEKRKFRFPFSILLSDATILRRPTTELEQRLASNRILMTLRCGS